MLKKGFFFQWKKRRTKKEKKLKFPLLHRLAGRLMRLQDRIRSEDSKRREQQQFKELYFGPQAEERGREEKRKYWALAIGVFLLTLAFCGLYEVKNKSFDNILNGEILNRQQEDVPVTLLWANGENKGSIDVSILAQRRPENERDEMFLFAKEYVEETIRGTNESLSSLQGDLTFPQEVPGTGIAVECQPGSYQWFNIDGSRTIHELPNEGAGETLTVTLTYYEETREYTLELYLLPEGSEEEQIQKRLSKTVQERNLDNIEETLTLPNQQDGKTIRWKLKKENTGTILFFLGLIVSILLPILEKRRRDEAIQKREKELMEDYPQLVSKFLLLLNAGLSIRKVWERLTKDYQENKENDSKIKYVYEEMLLALHEMENGMSEAKAYERFGKRCRLLPYLRFSTVLVQNLQKGAKGSLPLLEQEALTAFEERKEAAKRKGEEAGTKLLLPMLGMLGIVLVIVMYPAFSNF